MGSRRVAWVLRWVNIRVAIAEAWHAVRSGALAQASWETALRRAIVVALLAAIGAWSGDFTTWVPAALGAMQMALMLAPCTRKELGVYLIADIIAVSVSAALVLSMGGSWFAIPIVVAIAMVTGALSGSRGTSFSIALNATVIAVLFAPRSETSTEILSTVGYLALGSLVQAIAIFVFWRRDRYLTLTQLMGNQLAALSRIATDQANTGRRISGSLQVELDLSQALETSGVSGDSYQKARDVIAWLMVTRRGLVRWLEIRDPGLTERQGLSLFFSELRLRLVSPLPRKTLELPGVTPGWQCEADLVAALNGLQNSVSPWMRYRKDPGSSSRAVPLTFMPDLRHGVREWRSGIRMAVAITIAEVVAHLFNTPYSFWIPLSVVFILQTNWSFTFLRTFLRVAGTVAAVITIGALTSVITPTPLLVTVIVLLSALLAFKWTTGNFALATFAITCLILTLNTQLVYKPDVIEYRLLFTLIAAAISIAAALFWPTWRRPRVSDALAWYTSSVSAAVEAVKELAPPERSSDMSPLVSATFRCRDAIMQATPVITSALFEAGSSRLPAPSLLDALARSQRSLAQLLGINAYLFACAERTRDPRLDEGLVSDTLEVVGRWKGDPSTLPAVPADATVVEEQLDAISSAAYPAHVPDLSAEELGRVHLLQGRLLNSFVNLNDSIEEIARPIH